MRASLASLLNGIDDETYLCADFAAGQRFEPNWAAAATPRPSAQLQLERSYGSHLLQRVWLSAVDAGALLCLFAALQAADMGQCVHYGTSKGLITIMHKVGQ